jgi:lipopolysaccharide/colanic/teichoic acid biosynthesis glycosyltransferase
MENSIEIAPLTTERPDGPTKLFGSTAKRVLDIFASIAGLLLLSPLFLFVAYRIKHDSPGPVYYFGPRAGRGGKDFRIIKFRTMHERPESYQGPRVTAQDDPRITPIGHWLRDTKLNELPQLWNVLKGDMSLVGPRPEDPEIARSWPKDLRQEILSMRPGITSPASVLYRDEESRLNSGRLMETYLQDILPSKLRLDQLYVRHHSFWTDLDIIFWTMLVLLPRLKEVSPVERQIFIGPMAILMQRYVRWFSIDLVVTLVAMGIAGLIWRSMAPLNLGLAIGIVVAFGFAALFSAVNALLGVNRISWGKASAVDAIDLVPGVGLATLVALILNQYTPPAVIDALYLGSVPPNLSYPLLPPGLIVTASALAFAGFIVVRYRGRLVAGVAARWLAMRGEKTAAQERILIIGGGETGQFAAWMLNNGRYSGAFRVVGFVDDDMFKQDVRIRGLKVLGQRSDIPALVKKYDAGIIIFAIHNITALERKELLEICAATQARLFLFPDIPAALSGILQRAQPAGKQAAAQAQRAAGDKNTLPCELCLIKVSPMKVDSWLANLEQIAAASDIGAVQEEIQALRGQLRLDAAIQRAANQEEQA